MTDTPIRPKFISFDCYGTLTRFRMSEMAERLCADRIDARPYAGLHRGLRGLSPRRGAGPRGSPIGR